MTPPTGYRCMECGAVSDDGSEHADGCGQPDRDRARSKAEWYEQLASFIPTTPSTGKDAPAYRYGARLSWMPVPVDAGPEVDAHLAKILHASESLAARGHDPVTGDLGAVFCRRCGAFDVEATRGVPCVGASEGVKP